jgi:LysM repeat protein
MKQHPFSTLKLFLVIISAITFLSACELPSDRSEPIQLDTALQPPPAQLDPNALPTLDPNTPGVNPTIDPAATPDGQTSDGTTDTTGEQAPATGGEGETPVDPNQPRQTTIYVVQSGDTLGKIAQQFDVPIEEIAAANNMVSVDVLDIGQELTIPGDDFVSSAPATAVPTEGQTTAETPATGERVHTVQQGENLYRIGLQYGFTVSELQTYNNLANPDSLDVGQLIKIPPSE